MLFLNMDNSLSLIKVHPVGCRVWVLEPDIFDMEFFWTKYCGVMIAEGALVGTFEGAV